MLPAESDLSHLPQVTPKPNTLSSAEDSTFESSPCERTLNPLSEVQPNTQAPPPTAFAKILAGMGMNSGDARSVSPESENLSAKEDLRNFIARSGLFLAA